VATNRRSFLLTLASAAPALALGRAFAQSGPADGVRALAQAELARVGHRIPDHDVVGIADFGRASREPRLHLVDMRAGMVESFLVAHGRGSDPEHSGWLRNFSNEFNSNCSSQGAFLTGGLYVGHHGRSMRLVGLDPTNSNALPREIVVHAAPYVSPQMIREHGVLGRSEGCFALDAGDLPIILDRLGPGRLLVSTRL
jgi:hypothetical protein